MPAARSGGDRFAPAQVARRTAFVQASVRSGSGPFTSTLYMHPYILVLPPCNKNVSAHTER